MVHSRYSFKIRQLRSHLYLTCHPPRPRIHSPFTPYLNKRTLTPLPSLPSDLSPKQDLGEFMKELSQLESVSEKVSKLVERLKELHECKIRIAAGILYLYLKKYLYLILVNFLSFFFFFFAFFFSLFILILAVRVRLDKRQRILNEEKLRIAEMKRLIAEEKKIIAEKKKEIAEKRRKLNQRESHRDA
ncbi:unnamed protein product [Brassica rapa]|uniref:Uncharacterized protein n=1 Tax=Brassica campestris TaxID=3711 RepID=A0A8D9DMM3_BRACM|nr:unnamed protein product [Brassica rapa]